AARAEIRPQNSPISSRERQPLRRLLNPLLPFHDPLLDLFGFPFILSDTGGQTQQRPSAGIRPIFAWPRPPKVGSHTVSRLQQSIKKGGQRAFVTILTFALGDEGSDVKRGHPASTQQPPLRFVNLVDIDKVDSLDIVSKLAANPAQPVQEVWIFPRETYKHEYIFHHRLLDE